MLAIRHRGLVVFTAANPAIPAGGFIGESKVAILEGLSKSRDRVARSELIAGSLSEIAKRDRIHTWLQRERLSLPIVLKPNEGQRGSGVVIAKSSDELHAYLRQSTWTRSSRNMCRASSLACSIAGSRRRHAAGSSLSPRSDCRSSLEMATGRSSA